MRRVITAAMLGASLAAGTTLTACTEDTVEVAEYEDCDAEDKRNNEDDCGYWQKGSEYRVGAQPDSTWIFIYYSWVLQGLTRPPAGWIPPHGLKPPTRIVQRPKSKVCAMSATSALVAPNPPRPPAPAPRVNQPAPRVNNNPPKQQPAKPYTPPKPGVRPAGC